MNLRRLLTDWKGIILPPSVREWWLERQINRDFTARIRGATVRKDKDEIELLRDEYGWNLAYIRDLRQARIQRKWIRKAQKFMIPLPRQDTQKITEDYEDENWENSTPSGELLLKPHAMVNLRREVRREQKERREAFTHWITVIVGLVGGADGLGVHPLGLIVIVQTLGGATTSVEPTEEQFAALSSIRNTKGGAVTVLCTTAIISEAVPH